MPRIDKSLIKPGMMLTGGVHGVAHIKHAPLPNDLKQFEDAARLADQLAAAPALSEIEQRLADAKARLEEIRAWMRRR